MILSVRFPAPVTHVPKGMRSPRLAYVRDAVAAEIPEASASETRPVAIGDLPDGLLLHCDRLWRPLGDPSSPAGRDALAAVLEDAPGCGAHAAVVDAIRRSPLGACRPERDRDMFPPALRPDRGGIPPDPRRTVHDGTEAARRLARDFAQEGFLLVDGRAYARCVPLAWLTPMDSRVHRGVHVALGLDPLAGWLDRFPASPLSLGAAEEALAVPGGATVRPAALGEWSDLPAEAFGDAVAEALANAVPGALRFRMDRDLSPDRREGRDALLALERAGWTRSVTGENLPAALAAIGDACGTLARDGVPPRGHDHGYPRLARYVREAVVPWAGMPGADAAALSAFAA